MKNALLCFCMLISIIVINSCENPTTTNTKVTLPTISNVKIIASSDGLNLLWDIDDIDGYSKSTTIYRGENSDLLNPIGQTSTNSFLDKYVTPGKRYFYYISVSLSKQSMDSSGYSSYHTSSPEIISPLSTGGSGELPKISDLNAVGGGGKIILNWSMPSISISSSSNVIYRIRRLNYDPTIRYSYGSSNYFTILNNVHTDEEFTLSESLTSTYYYTVSYEVSDTDQNIIYIGPESNTVNAIPGII